MAFLPTDRSLFNLNAAENTRVSQMTTLFDGKTIGGVDLDNWTNIGPGSSLYANNKVNLSVTAGQYQIRQSRRMLPYFSGKSQLIEVTFDNFQTEGDCIKRVGYFTSSTTAPYDSSFDGFFIENNAGVYSLKMYNNGTLKLNILFEDMDNFSAIDGYNWENFTVCAFDFLWLGGAGLRFFVKVGEVLNWYILFDYAGTAKDTFMLNPVQAVRYEIRSVTSSGSFRNICSQVATEGSVNEAGKTYPFYNSAAVVTNTIGQIYPLIVVRRGASDRYKVTQIVEIGVVSSATSDSGLLLLIKNPTFTGTALTFNTVNGVEVAYNSAANQRVTAGTGTQILAVPVSQFGIVNNTLKENFLSMLTATINNISDEFALCYRPITSNQSNVATLIIKQY